LWPVLGWTLPLPLPSYERNTILVT
jgi:hypothetical protein